MSSPNENAWQLQFVQLLSVVGIVVAHYLWLFHEGALILSCTSSGWDDCGKVSGPTAQYASVGGVSVALIGLIGYILIFLLIWLRPFNQWLRDNTPELLLSLTGIAFLSSLGLTALELFVIHAFCRYCVVSAVIVTIMFALSLLYVRQERT